MTISYKWLSEYLPVKVEAEKLNRMLTSIGLEVESMQSYEEIRGGLQGLVIGEVLSVEKHPDADKLTVTRVDTAAGEPLQIVCGAPNVAAGQKVIVALPGTTIYPFNGEPLTMKTTRIRGVESQGMICAEDEIGMGESHAGILVLPPAAKKGTAASDYFKPYTDTVFEIGLTPNRMDAMSHMGVARDVCAWLSYHERKDLKPVSSFANAFKVDNHSLTIQVKVENEKDCPRYSGLSLSGITIGASPDWLQQKLKAIGLRPINNIVDITNFIQHETGQPLHAFDADRIRGKKIFVKNLPEGTAFTTLDEKERKLSSGDLMICDAEGPICIAGVFGGLHSGVGSHTKNVFLESACFDPVSIRKTSFSHNLRTDAATRFEKGTDISATVTVLKRAAKLIREICGGKIASEIVDVYPDPKPKTEISVKWHYIKKLSGKNYHPDAVREILGRLGFEVQRETVDELRVAVPFNKPDVSLPADVVEEIIRIDGLDNIEIPGNITISPSIEESFTRERYQEKLSASLVGLGFQEMMTNSITNAAYFSEQEREGMVNMLNSLSAEHNIMRSSLLETAMEVVAHNLNRKNLSLRLFEFGKVYSNRGPGAYEESDRLCLVVTGNKTEGGWQHKALPMDIFYLKGVLETIFRLMGVGPDSVETAEVPRLQDHRVYKWKEEIVAGIGKVNKKMLDRFGVKQPVFYAELNWGLISEQAGRQLTAVEELPRFPSVQRDIAMVVSRDLPWERVEKSLAGVRVNQLKEVRLFDVFESEKLGQGKKSMAVNFTFVDKEKTLTDKEIESWMQTIMTHLEKELQAEIRK